MIFVKRANEPARKNDGRRILIDSSLPRGIKKETLQVDLWAKTLAPSSDLRDWLEENPAEWEEFQKRYFAELDQKPEAWKSLVDAARDGDVTLVCTTIDPDRNNATALRIYLIRHLKIRRGVARTEMATA